MEYLKIRNLLILAFMVLFISCGENFENEKAQLEVLRARLEETGKVSGFDVLELKSRQERIGNRYNFLKEGKDSISEELGITLENYRAIINVYQLYIDHYSGLELQKAKVKTALDELQKELEMNAATAQDYAAKLGKIDNDLGLLEMEVNKYGKPVLEVELLFDRLDGDIQKEIDLLTKPDSTRSGH
jgi:chromosome segregation ATPase